MTDAQKFLARPVTKRPVYPITQREFNIADRSETPKHPILDRMQLVIAPHRYALLIRHLSEHHWCGYVLIPRFEWNRLEETIRSRLPITYVGCSGQYITWTGPTVKTGRLTIPVQIELDNGPEGDFWVGFDRWHGKPTIESTADDMNALEQLIQFEKTIWEIRSGDLALGR